MLDTAVLPFGVLSNGDNVHILVRRLVANQRFAGTYVGVEREFSGERERGRLLKICRDVHWRREIILWREGERRYC